MIAWHRASIRKSFSSRIAHAFRPYEVRPVCGQDTQRRGPGIAVRRLGLVYKPCRACSRAS